MDQWTGWRRKGSAFLTQEKVYYELPRKLRVEASYGFSMRMVKGKAFLKYPKADWDLYFLFFFFLINAENKDLFPAAISWAILHEAQVPAQAGWNPRREAVGMGFVFISMHFLKLATSEQSNLLRIFLSFLMCLISFSQ